MSRNPFAPATRFAALLLLALASALPAVADTPAAPPAPRRPVRFVDDRGQAITAPLDVCFDLPTRTDCGRTEGGQAAVAPDGFLGVKVTGDEHGPVALRRGDIQAQADGSYLVTVPRRGWLRIVRQAPPAPAAGAASPGSASAGPASADAASAGARTAASSPAGAAQTGADAALAVELYSPFDDVFREPLWRGQLTAGEERVRVPAGNVVVSLRAGRDAPDLQRLAVPPGADARVTYHSRSGWSLVARCLAAATGKPVPGVAAKVMDAPGYGQPARQIAQAAADADGLVLISGIAVAASLQGDQPGFLPAEARGLVAPAGQLAVARLALVVGGHMRATVALQGRPLNAAHCTLTEQMPNPFDAMHSSTVWESNTDAHGVCRSIALPEGSYLLTVKLPDAAERGFRVIKIEDGRDTEEDVDLAPIRLSGTVRRGGKPVPGYKVAARPLAAGGAGGADEALSDANGAYEITLWTAGKYNLMLRSPSQSSAFGGHVVEVQEGDEPKQDFNLDAATLHGRVIDQAGSPVARASVILRWQAPKAAGGFSISDQQGQFDIELQGTGSGTLTALRSGYGSADPVPFEVSDENTSPPPVTMVLSKQSTMRGSLVSAAGAPVAGALVASAPPGADIPAGETRTDPAGRFEVAVPSGPARLFISGPGCPLFTADLAAPDTTAATPDGTGAIVPAAPTGGDAPGGADALPGAGGPDGADSPGQVWQCPDQSGTIVLSLVEEGGKPAAPYFMGFSLRRNGVPIPTFFLREHLALLGLPNHVDGSGQIILGGLSPSQYDVVLMDYAPPDRPAEGTATVEAGTAVPLKLTMPARYMHRRSPT